MKSKLTLSVSPLAVRRGKRIAALRKQSLSELVSQYLEKLEAEPDKTTASTSIDPRLVACQGAYRLAPGLNLEDMRLRSLLQKHGGKK